MPYDNSILVQSNLSFSLVFQPFAEIGSNEKEVQKVESN
jgi:hypothetical protein